jgi:DNA-binding MarR family transcriptional regulator
MTARVASRASNRTRAAVGTPILEQLATTLANPDQRHEAAGLLRALTGVLLHAVLPLRQENVEPYETGLLYLARQLSAEVRDKELACDPRYLLGRIDAMFDLCSVAIDHSLSSEVLKQAKRAHGREILHHLVHHGDTAATELANVIGIGRSHLSNILRWMEAIGLVRRVEIGRSTLVCLGPKGQGAYDTLAAEQREPAPPPSAAREGLDRVDQPGEVEASGGSAQAVYQALQELAETRGRTIPDVLREALAMERWLAVRDITV